MELEVNSWLLRYVKSPTRLNLHLKSHEKKLSVWFLVPRPLLVMCLLSELCAVFIIFHCVPIFNYPLLQGLINTESYYYTD